MPITWFGVNQTMYTMPDLFDPSDISRVNNSYGTVMKWIFLGTLVGSFVNIKAGMSTLCII